MIAPLPLRIAGIGRYLPIRTVTCGEIEELCGLPTDERRGTKSVTSERRWVDGETNSFMGAEAAKEALADAGMEPTDFDLLINASGTAEQAMPDGGPLIQRQLARGSSGVPCMTLHATCLSFLVALDVSASLLATRRYKRILIVTSEIASIGLNFKDPTSATLFGDAAAAAVVTLPRNGEASCIHSARMETYGDGADLTAIRGGGCRKHPNSSTTRPEDNLFHMQGPDVYRLVRRHLGDFLERLRPGLSRSLGTIKRVIPHQPSDHGLRFLRRFSWADDKVVRTFDRLGNCIAASIPVTLYQAVQDGRVRRNDEVLLLGTGAGLSIGGVILTF